MTTATTGVPSLFELSLAATAKMCTDRHTALDCDFLCGFPTHVPTMKAQKEVVQHVLNTNKVPPAAAAKALDPDSPFPYVLAGTHETCGVCMSVFPRFQSSSLCAWTNRPLAENDFRWEVTPYAQNDVVLYRGPVVCLIVVCDMCVTTRLLECTIRAIGRCKDATAEFESQNGTGDFVDGEDSETDENDTGMDDDDWDIPVAMTPGQKWRLACKWFEHAGLEQPLMPVIKARKY